MHFFESSTPSSLYGFGSSFQVWVWFPGYGSNHGSNTGVLSRSGIVPPPTTHVGDYETGRAGMTLNWNYQGLVKG